jgi:hypothetical protein
MVVAVGHASSRFKADTWHGNALAETAPNSTRTCASICAAGPHHIHHGPPCQWSAAWAAITISDAPKIEALWTLIGPTPQQLVELDKQAAKQKYRVDSHFVELNLPADKLVERSTYWYSMWSHRRNEVWKGYLEVDLNPAHDPQSFDILDEQDALGTRP